MPTGRKDRSLFFLEYGNQEVIMKRLMKQIVIVSFSLLVHGSYAEVDDGTVIHNGEATYYSDGAFGHCGFPVERQPLYHGAMNHTDYDTAASCGTWVHITGPKGEVTAYIDDECPECKEGDIDLGPGTFDMIADRVLGRVPIQWHYVASPDTTPIIYYWKEGSSQWHIELQIRNHRYAVRSVEIKNASSDWVIMPRTVYNYFRLPGGINGEDGPYSVRVTDIYSRQLTDTGLILTESTESVGIANFAGREDIVKIRYLQTVKRSMAGGEVKPVMFGVFRKNEKIIGREMQLFTLAGKRVEASIFRKNDGIRKPPVGIYLLKKDSVHRPVR